MSNALKTMLEGSTLSEGAKAVIVEAWETKLQEAREELTASLRDEFANRYEKDKSELVEAMNSMITDTLEEHVKELASAKKSVMEEKVLSKRKTNENIEKLNSFILPLLKNEINDFVADRKAISAKVSKFDRFVKENLENELTEFRAERQKLIEERVEVKIKAKRELAESKQELISKMTKELPKLVFNEVKQELSQLKNELVESKRKHFGMKIFEAFAADFGSSFFNERSEMQKLLNVIAIKDKKINEAQKRIVEKDNLLNESVNKLRVTENRFTRTQSLNELCGSLSGSKRKLMEELLEKVPSNKLTESFNNYLPSVLSSDTSIKKPLIESKPVLKEHTGDKRTSLFETKQNSSVDHLDETIAVFKKNTFNN